MIWEIALGVLGIAALLLFYSLLVEKIVEFFISIWFEKIEKIKPYSWLLRYVAGAAGMVGAFYYQFDLMSIAGWVIGREVAISTLGMILTGGVIGMGADRVHQILKNLGKS